jgi:hypothetical protein
MGIDGIGKPTTTPHLDPSVGLEGTQLPTADVNSVTGTGPSTVSGSEASSNTTSVFSRYTNGEITRDQYLDLRVDEAISPYVNRMSPEQLDFMRTTLREQLELDPTLVELTRRATEKANLR